MTNRRMFEPAATPKSPAPLFSDGPRKGRRRRDAGQLLEVVFYVASSTPLPVALLRKTGGKCQRLIGFSRTRTTCHAYLLVKGATRKSVESAACSAPSTFLK